MKFDDILTHYVGEFGTYQKRIYFLVCIPSLVAAIFTMLPVFILVTPDHRCQLDGLENDTYAIQSEAHRWRVNASIPLEMSEDGENELSKCYVYRQTNGTGLANESRSLCDKWVFDKSVTTAVTEYKMVCEYTLYQSHFKMITFLGGLVGAFINGLVSDMYGRKKAFLVCLGLYMIATVILILSPVYSLFLAMRFFQGMFGIGIFMISFVMVLELVGPNYRMLAGMVIEFFWCAGLFLLVGLAYLVPVWTDLLLVVSLPCLALFSYIWIIPESPRWLISKGRLDEAKLILQKMAAVNDTSLPDWLVLEEVKDGDVKRDDKVKVKETGHIWKLFTHRVILIRLAIIIFNRFTLNMSYYGFWLNVESLSGNIYLNFTISSAVETVANLVILALINRLGRKPLYCGSVFTSAVGFLLTIFPIYLGSDGDYTYALVLMMVGKFGTTAAYSVIYVYLSEVVPTSLRNTALGLSLFVEVFGGVLSPYIFDLGKLMDERSSKAFPMIVFGAFSLVAGLMALMLPETKDRQLPETVEDAAKFGESEEL